jgi:hypothetical protein
MVKPPLSQARHSNHKNLSDLQAFQIFFDLEPPYLFELESTEKVASLGVANFSHPA